MSVVRGQEARLTWKFAINETLYFHGIVWTIKDPVFGNDTKLLWMDRYEKLYRHSYTQNRDGYDIRFTSDTIMDGGVQLTIVILKAEYIHENKYVCHVIRPDRKSNITPSEIELKVKRKYFVYESRTFIIPRKYYHLQATVRRKPFKCCFTLETYTFG